MHRETPRKKDFPGGTPNFSAANEMGTNEKSRWLPPGQGDMNIQDVLVFQDPVKGGYLMVDKNVEKKIGPVFWGPQAREPLQQFLNGGPGFQLQD